MKKKLAIASAALGALSLPFLVGACATAGASSASLGSASSLSGSSMSSAAKQEHHHHYSTDVQAATRSAIAAGGGEREILRSVSRVAESHSITDWEAEDTTFIAIGKALKDAGQKEDAVIALADRIAGGVEAKAELLLKGYYS